MTIDLTALALDAFILYAEHAPGGSFDAAHSKRCG